MNENDKRLCERIVKGNMDQTLYVAWMFIVAHASLFVLCTLLWLFIPGTPNWWFGFILAGIGLGVQLRYQHRLYGIIKYQAKALETRMPNS